MSFAPPCPTYALSSACSLQPNHLSSYVGVIISQPLKRGKGKVALCGIAGIVDGNAGGIDIDTIVRMVRSLEHRGPDDEGTYLGPECEVSVGLGHRRLSIIDLSRDARQPISNEDGSIRLVCNGEIYNYKEIRERVQQRGHRLRSKTDSEALVHLYEEHGLDFVKHLQGMFAFGLWDGKLRRLVIGRDRLGIKPLYYYFMNGRFVFASEIKSILIDRGVKREMDLVALDQYFSFLYIPAPGTIYRDIFKVMPGTILTLERGQLKESQFWDLAVDDRAGFGRKGHAVDYYSDCIYELLESAIKDRMISDVPLGAFLSGGIDSSAIVAIMSKFSSQPVKTFSIGFGEEERHYDELKYARAVADRFGADHREFMVRSDIVGLLPTVVKHFDEPFANPTAILMYLLSKETKKHVSVALSGTGGDEAFSGYTRYAGMRLAEYAQYVPKTLRQILGCLTNKIPESSNGKHLGRRVRSFVEGTMLPPEERYVSWVSVFNDDMKRELFTGDISPESNSVAGSYIGRYLTSNEAANIHDRVFYTDVKTYLPNNQLEYVDKMSMAHALEVRVPFCDHKLLEFAATIPHHLKIRGMNTKHLLKKAVSRVLPQDIMNRKKTGFNVPLGLWFQGELKSLMKDELSEDRIKRSGIFDHKVVARIMREHESGYRDYSLHIWALLVFQVWDDAYCASR